MRSLSLQGNELSNLHDMTDKRLLERASMLQKRLQSAAMASGTCSLLESHELIRVARQCVADIAQHVSHSMLSDVEGRNFSDLLQLQDARRHLLRTLDDLNKKLTKGPSVLHQVRLRGHDHSGESVDAANHQAHSDDEFAALCRTRSLLAVENVKMEQVMANMRQSSDALRQLCTKLDDVDATLSHSKKLLVKIVQIKSLEDLVLRASWVVFFCVVALVWSQRLLGFGLVVVA